MRLSGQYDKYYPDCEIFFANTSEKPSNLNIIFYDEKGAIAHKTEKMTVSSHGTLVVYMSKISELKSNTKGLFLIQCEPGIRGEYRHRNDNKVIRGIIPLTEPKTPFLAEGHTIFISYTMRKENDDLYNLISRFVKSLGFKILSASESGKPDIPPGIQIRDMIKLSDSLVALLTKDDEITSQGKKIFRPSPNVIDEIGQASDKTVIMLVESDTEIPSNLETRATYVSFTKGNTGKLLVDLAETLRKESML